MLFEVHRHHLYAWQRKIVRRRTTLEGCVGSYVSNSTRYALLSLGLEARGTYAPLKIADMRLYA